VSQGAPSIATEAMVRPAYELTAEGLAVPEVAGRLGVRPASLSHWIGGHVEDPTALRVGAAVLRGRATVLRERSRALLDRAFDANRKPRETPRPGGP